MLHKLRGYAGTSMLAMIQPRAPLRMDAMSIGSKWNSFGVLLLGPKVLPDALAVASWQLCRHTHHGQLWRQRRASCFRQRQGVSCWPYASNRHREARCLPISVIPRPWDIFHRPSQDAGPTTGFAPLLRESVGFAVPHGPNHRALQAFVLLSLPAKGTLPEMVRVWSRGEAMCWQHDAA